MVRNQVRKTNTRYQRAYLLRGETCVGASALLVAGFEFNMETFSRQTMAQDFVQKHLEAGDLMPTLATLMQLTADQLHKLPYGEFDVEEKIMDWFAIMIEINATCEIIRKKPKPLEYIQ